MPYIVDLDKRANKMMYLSVKPHGWVYNDENGVQIEFGNVWLDGNDPEPSMCMRVKGTKHVWAWFQHTFHHLAGNDYAKFFTKQLEEFRIEFLLWIHSPLYSRCDWVREYYEMFQGRFYNFSEEEQKQYEESVREYEADQQKIDDFVQSERRRKQEEANDVWSQFR